MLRTVIPLVFRTQPRRIMIEIFKDFIDMAKKKNVCDVIPVGEGIPFVLVGVFQSPSVKRSNLITTISKKDEDAYLAMQDEFKKFWLKIAGGSEQEHGDHIPGMVDRIESVETKKKVLNMLKLLAPKIKTIIQVKPVIQSYLTFSDDNNREIGEWFDSIFESDLCDHPGSHVMDVGVSGQRRVSSIIINSKIDITNLTLKNAIWLGDYSKEKLEKDINSYF